MLGSDHLSLRRKLLLIIGLSGGLGLVAAGLAFLAYDQRSFSRLMAQNLRSQAQIVGNNSTAALEFDNETDAAQVLSGLAANPHLVRAVLLTPEGRLFARFPESAGDPGEGPLPAEDLTYTASDGLHVVHTIRDRGRVFGRVHLVASRDALRQRLAQYAAVVVLVLLGAGGLALLLFSRLHRLVTVPVSHLTETATRVAEDKDYSLRARQMGTDELGRLTACFNEMLRQIQSRDVALQKAREDLERRVEARTSQLSRANAQLRQNIAERSRLEGQLRQAQKMEAVGQLAGGVAHDFNNILTVILGQAALLLSIGGLSREDTEALREIESSARRAAHLTRQLLTFSRRQVIRMAPLQLNQVLQNFARMLQRLLGEPITLRFELGADLPAVRADVHLLEQVVMNLAVNARDAMPQGGELSIATRVVTLSPQELARHTDARPGRHVCLSVQDTGCGMDTVTQQKLFEPFFTTKPQGQGTGLGLATVYGILKQHEGWIQVSSQLGQGSTFELYLPTCDQPAETPCDTQFWGSSPRGSETILVVEDEEAVRHFVGNCLRRHGYQVIEARHGKHALELWGDHAHHVDLLLTDLVMPEGISGCELADRLLGQKPGLGIIYASGYSNDLVKMQAAAAATAGYLEKPFDPLRLVRAVREQLDRSSAPALAVS